MKRLMGGLRISFFEPFHFSEKVVQYFCMHISWYGQSCFKIEAKEGVVAIDPFSRSTVPAHGSPRFKADILLITHAEPDHRERGAIMGDPFVIDAPGEYEVKGVAVRGIQTFHDGVSGKEHGLNTVYVVHAEGITFCHLGGFGESELREELVEEIGDVDILFLPVGGVSTVDARGAVRLLRAVEPRIVIPMHYKIPGLAGQYAGVDPFLKEVGGKHAEPLDRFSVKKKELPEEETRVIVLKPL